MNDVQTVNDETGVSQEDERTQFVFSNHETSFYLYKDRFNIPLDMNLAENAGLEFIRFEYINRYQIMPDHISIVYDSHKPLTISKSMATERGFELLRKLLKTECGDPVIDAYDLKNEDGSEITQIDAHLRGLMARDIKAMREAREEQYRTYNRNLRKNAIFRTLWTSRRGGFTIMPDGFIMPVDFPTYPTSSEFIRFNDIVESCRKSNPDRIVVRLRNGDIKTIFRALATDNGFELLEFMLNECT